MPKLDHLLKISTKKRHGLLFRSEKAAKKCRVAQSSVAKCEVDGTSIVRKLFVQQRFDRELARGKVVGLKSMFNNRDKLQLAFNSD